MDGFGIPATTTTLKLRSTSTTTAFCSSTATCASTRPTTQLKDPAHPQLNRPNVLCWISGTRATLRNTSIIEIRQPCFAQLDQQDANAAEQMWSSRSS